MKQNRFKFTAVEERGMFFIFDLPNGKQRIIDKDLCKNFVRMNTTRRFKKTFSATMAAMMQLNMYNCDFPTNYYCVLN